MASCGVIGDVTAYFRIPPGDEYRDYFPNMGLAPELDGSENAFVVVYDGEVSGLLSGQPGSTRGPVTDAICVVTPDGANVYANVSRDGMVLPPGAWRHD